MRIDGIINQQYSSNVDTRTEKASGGVSAAFMADAVSFGSSEDGIMGGSGAKSSFLSGCDGSMESLKNQASILKDNLSAIFKKMDTGSAVKMDEDGIDVNNTDADKIVTVVEQIQIKLAMYCDDFQATIDIDEDALRKVIGDGAAAMKIAGELKKNGVKPTKENVSEIMGACEMASRIDSVDDGMKAYLMQNDMAPTVRNVYISANAGYVNKTGVISDAEWQEMLPQAERVLQEAGETVTDENLERVRWMLDNDIQVTPESLERLEALDGVQEILGTDELIERIAASMTEGKAAKDALINGEKLPWEEAVKAVKTVEEATEENIAAFAAGGEYTLEALAGTVYKGETAVPDRNDYKYVKASRELQEIRLMMTLEAAWTMERSGISVNTTDISDLIDELKKYELNIFNLNREDGGNEVTLMEVEQVSIAMVTIDSLRFVPSAVIGSVVDAKEEPTVNAMMYHAPAVAAKIEAAGNAYEALSTEIRSDLGDSISKAIKASTGDILSDMGYEDNEANRRAVRILAYNNMEISRRNIDKVKSIDYSANELFKNMTPQKVLNMIREGHNPLETSVEELNGYFINMEESARPEVEKYSEFLYRMDKSGKITPEEREKFVGIYSLISKFQKDGMKAAGALLNQNLELTMGNLLTAYMSRRDSGMEFTVDDGTSPAEYKDKVTYYKNLLGGIKGKVTPEALSSVEDDFDSMMPEQFAQALRESEPAKDDAVYARYVETARNAAQLEENVLRVITDNEISSTYNNIMAAQTVAEDPGSIFDGYKKLAGDEELEERLTEALESKESAQNEYDSLMENARRLADEAVGRVDSYIDMEALRMLGNNMKLMGALAHKNNYRIPYKTQDGTGVINLKIIETGENTGSFVIKMRDGRFGGVTVEAKADSRFVHARIMCEDKESEELLNIKAKEITEALKQRGTEDVRISVNRAKSQPEGKSAVKDGVSTEILFASAKIFIRSLTN